MSEVCWEPETYELTSNNKYDWNNVLNTCEQQHAQATCLHKTSRSISTSRSSNQQPANDSSGKAAYSKKCSGHRNSRRTLQSENSLPCSSNKEAEAAEYRQQRSGKRGNEWPSPKQARAWVTHSPQWLPNLGLQSKYRSDHIKTHLLLIPTITTRTLRALIIQTIAADANSLLWWLPTICLTMQDN